MKTAIIYDRCCIDATITAAMMQQYKVGRAVPDLPLISSYEEVVKIGHVGWNMSKRMIREGKPLLIRTPVFHEEPEPSYIRKFVNEFDVAPYIEESSLLQYERSLHRVVTLDQHATIREQSLVWWNHQNAVSAIQKGTPFEMEWIFEEYMEKAYMDFLKVLKKELSDKLQRLPVEIRKNFLGIPYGRAGVVYMGFINSSLWMSAWFAKHASMSKIPGLIVYETDNQGRTLHYHTPFNQEGAVAWGNILQHAGFR